LEDRLTPATTAVPWPDPGHLTLSFAPDGTSTGQQASALFQHLNSVAATRDWQLAILRAYQTWAVEGNANVSVVSDGGEAFGAPGVPEGDSRFGDIRIGMAQLADTSLATSNPFTWAGTTWAGDALLNSAINFGVNGQGGPYDLFSVMLHEAGHAFGVEDNSTDPTSVMYDAYQGVRTGLSAADATDFRSLYGARTPDAYEGAAGNNSFATAYNFTSLPAAGVVLDADLGKIGEADYYKFTAPLLSTGFVINLSTAHISSLQATVSVYDGNHHLLASASAADPLHGDLSLSVPAGLLGGTYYIKVSGATNDVFSVGSYRMSIGVKTALGLSLPSALYTPPVAVNNLGSVLSAALHLLPIWPGPSDLRFNATFRGDITSSGEQDWFYVSAPPAATYGSGPLVMVAEAWGTDSLAPLHPYVEVWTAGPSPQLLASQVLTNDHGVFTLQLPDAASPGGYYLRLRPLTPGGGNDTGDYFLGVNIHQEPPVALAPIAGGTLTQSAPQQFTQMTLNQNELWHFSLSADLGGAAVAEEVQMQIYDAAGNLVFTLIAYGGQPPSTGCVYLAAGTYTLRFVAVAQQPDQFVSLAFDLDSEILSDPIGPIKTTTTSTPPPTYSTTAPTTTSTKTYSSPTYS
jgi:hypothetical protein